MTPRSTPATQSDFVALSREDLPVDPTAMARYLVGKVLVHDLPEGRVSGRIVEMEAYPLGDSTSHAFRGRRADNGSMFLAPGHAYVKLTYGVSYMLNISAEAEGVGAGVLIRALEPLEGIEIMRARRPRSTPRDLARGPGRLTLALGIGPPHDGVDLCAGRGLWLASLAAEVNGTLAPTRVGITTRIGLTRETHRLLRFYAAGSPFVSGPRHLLSA
ncbi:DNA-3-methyladenine glycosylase [Paraburkholderia phosphatilytica]|uniref:DNA-3-methyladenine glycosylase n=1 Tax=Paraburkholderia phosphatilytica TaxID=2282883 RepID=UPI000E51B2F6|nr:DNA-3-methyladenine glycosylase [Paraburkholderia phosphatilytica]